MPETLTPPTLADAFADRLRAALQRHAPPPTAAAPDGAPLSEGPDAAGGQCREDDPLLCEPVGSGEYVVGKNDCLSSIAKETGHLWQTIWNDPANGELREVRRDPNVLAVGDRLTIPELRQKSEPGQTELRHRFVRIGQPTIFQLRLAHNGKPLAHLPFELTYDTGDKFKGSTNSDGFLRGPMPSHARHGTLLVGKDDEQRRYELRFGTLEPVNHLVGVRQRLRNLGFYEGPDQGELDERTAAALRHYQKQRGLPPSGEADGATRRRLHEEHGS